MERLGLLLLAALVAVPVGAAQASLDSQDDASSGQDAPDTASAEVFVESGETYQGELRDGDYHDWYAFEADAGDRVEVRVSGAYGCFEIAKAPKDEAAATCAQAPYAETQVLEATLDASGTWFVHYQNVPADVYQFGLGVDEPAPSPTGAPATEIPEPPAVPYEEQDDAGSGGDAPDQRSADIEIASGTVYEGELVGSTFGLTVEDEVDWYTFTGQAGQEAEFKLAASLACLRVYDSQGEELDFTCADAALGVGSTSVDLDSDGRYFVSVSYFAPPQDYRFSVGLDEAAPDPGWPVQPSPYDDSEPARRADTPSAVREASNTDQPVALPVDSGHVLASLEPNEDLVAADPAGEPRFFEGHLVERPDSEVRVALDDGTVQGTVFAAGAVVPVGVLADAIAAATDEVRVGEPFDPVQPRVEYGHAGGCLSATPHYVPNPAGLTLGWPTRTLDVAFAVDEAFVDRFDDWQGKALEFVNRIDGFYQAAGDLEVAVADLHAHAGALNESTTGEALSASADHYDAAHPDLDRESVHLFAGHEYSNAAGQAECIGAAGNTELAYSTGEALHEGTIGFGPFEWFPMTTEKIAAHEIGHILSGHHHYANCAERAPTYEPMNTFSACTLMINDVGLASLEFSTMNTLVTRGWSDAEDL